MSSLLDWNDISEDEDEDDESLRIEGNGDILFDRGNDSGSTTAAASYFLPIMEQSLSPRHTHLLPDEVAICGLVVTVAKERSKGRFTRLGAWDFIFNVRSHRDLMQDLLHMSYTLMDKSLYEECLQCDEHGLPQYIITLV